MKIIITESQYNNLFIQRRFDRIDELVNEKMRYYPPCDYMYGELYDFNDYYGDVRNAVISEILTYDLKLQWVESDIENIEYFYEIIEKGMYEVFYDKVREYFDKVIGEGCDDE